MAYNKRKHLEANIAALRIAFAPSTVLTPQQREALAAYSGFGALKCVLRPLRTTTSRSERPTGNSSHR